MEEKKEPRKTRRTRTEDGPSLLASPDYRPSCDVAPRTRLRLRNPLPFFVSFVFFVVPPVFCIPSEAGSVVSGGELVVLPGSTRLVGPHARQRFVVEQIDRGVGV